MLGDAGGGDLECFGAIEFLTNSLFFVDEFATLAWGWTHGCLIEEGAVKCFGKCDGGACGRRTRSPTHRVPAVVDGVIGPSDAVAGGEHSCAIDQDGVVWCWGGNTLGQLGRGTVEEMGEAALPAAVPEPVIGLAGGLAYTCAFNDTGVWCWGQGENGQLGDGAAADSATPVEVIWW